MSSNPGVLDPELEAAAAILARAEFLDSEIGYDSSGEYNYEPDYDSGNDTEPEPKEWDPDSAGWEAWSGDCRCESCLMENEGYSLYSTEIGWARY